MEWNDEIIVRLRGLWMEGYSTAEIGRRIGVSKNAVVGKAHRLGLDARPSPIRRGGPSEGPARPQAPRRVVGPTLPPLPAGEALQHPEPLRRLPHVAETVPAMERSAPAAPAAAAAPQVRAVPPRASRLVACCWPIGEPGTPSFRFCDGEALPGKPYCAQHATLAYVKVRDRREEAA